MSLIQFRGTVSCLVILWHPTIKIYRAKVFLLLPQLHEPNKHWPAGLTSLLHKTGVCITFLEYEMFNKIFRDFSNNIFKSV